MPYKKDKEPEYSFKEYTTKEGRVYSIVALLILSLGTVMFIYLSNEFTSFIKFFFTCGYIASSIAVVNCVRLIWKYWFKEKL